MNKIKICVLLFAVGFGMMDSGCCSYPEICIERTEVSGYMNIVPVTVYVDDGAVATLASKSLLSIPVEPGRHIVCLEYYNPYQNRNLLNKQEMNILVPNRPRNFVLSPIIKNEAYSGDWTLISEKQAKDEFYKYD